MRLTFDMTRDSRTIYFPLEKSSDFPADLTVMVRPACEHGFSDLDEFSAGFAFCNPADQFIKGRGRVIAYHRMRINGPPGIHGSAQDIIDAILAKMITINKRRDPYIREPNGMMLGAYCPDMDEGAIEADLYKMLSYDALAEYFTKKCKNAEDQRASSLGFSNYAALKATYDG